MAVSKKPARPKAPSAAQGPGALDLMELQDKRAKGDSRASRTARMSFSTTPEFKKIVDDAAYERRMPMSHLVEEAIRQYLGLE
ncbi:MAG: hypothetical protein ACI4OC_00425 [Coriobacteriales bacterium]